MPRTYVHVYKKGDGLCKFSVIIMIFAVGILSRKASNNEFDFKVTNNLSPGKRYKFNPQKQNSGSSIHFKYAQQKLTFFFSTLTRTENTRRQLEFTQSCIFQQ